MKIKKRKTKEKCTAHAMWKIQVSIFFALFCLRHLQIKTSSWNTLGALGGKQSTLKVVYVVNNEILAWCSAMPMALYPPQNSRFAFDVQVYNLTLLFTMRIWVLYSTLLLEMRHWSFTMRHRTSDIQHSSFNLQHSNIQVSSFNIQG